MSNRFTTIVISNNLSGDDDKGLDPLSIVSDTTLQSIISLLLEHARFLGKDIEGFYCKFTTASLRILKNHATFGHHSFKLLDAVCNLLSTDEYNCQFEKITEFNSRGTEKVYFRLNITADDMEINCTNDLGKYEFKCINKI